MGFDPKEHHRHSIRVKGYDYSQPGMYFVTVCVSRRRCILGQIGNGKIVLSRAGEAVRQSWFELQGRFASVQLDAFVVMPNHVHGVIVLLRPGSRLGTTRTKAGGASPAPTSGVPTLGDIVGAFKSISAIRVNRLTGKCGQPVWQRNYYEHVVRGGDDLDEIRRYITENPSRWDEDPENPKPQSQPRR